MNRVMIALASLAFAGCLAAKLEPPAEDHYLQTRAIAERCDGAYYDRPCSPELREDLKALCDQAEAIHALAQGRDPGQCFPDDGGAR